jgi:putative MATE family efflux protein
MLTSYHQLDKQFWRKMTRIALPVSLQSMLFSLLGVIDVFMVSQLGEAPTAAVGVGNRIFFFNLILIVGLSGAVSVLASQYFGAGDMKGVRRTLAQSWLTSLLFSLPFIILYLLWPAQIVAIVADDPDYVTYASDYLMITGVSILFTALVVPLEAALRSIGEVRLPTYVGFISVLVNAVLNALLIFGLFGFPELGVVGAAIGTLVSRLLQILLLFALVARDFNQVLPTREDWHQAKQTKHRKSYIKIALPMTLHQGIWAAGILVHGVIIGKLGVSELAIVSLLAPVEGVLITTFLGFAVAASTLLGHELGAENYQTAAQHSWWYVATSCLLASLLATACFMAAPLIEHLLIKTSLPDTELALNACLVMIFGMVLRVFNMVGVGGVLKSGGDIKFSMFIDLFSQWGVGIPLAYYTVVVLAWPLHWVLLIILLEEVVKIALTSYRIQSKKWLNNLLHDAQGETASLHA